MPIKILIVDDDANLLKFLNHRLKVLGYEVMQAEDGVQGYEVAVAQRPDLIVSDWMMPKADGLEFCRKVKEHPDLRFTYFLLLTAKDSADDKVAGMEQGADDFLTKPFNDKELIARIKVGLRITSLQKQLSKYQHTKAITELAVTIGHEINNPLGILMLTLQVMKKKLGTDRVNEFEKDIETMMMHGNRVADIVRRLCTLEDPRFKPYLKDSDVQMIDFSDHPTQ